jgi:hypothetical protein
MHDIHEVCERYGVSPTCPAWDEYLRLWDEREKKIRTYLRKKTRAIVHEEKRLKKARNQKWGLFPEETELHEWYSPEQIRLVCEVLLRPDAFDGFVIEAERLYPEPDLVLPEPCVAHTAPSAEPRRFFKRARNPNSVVFHATGDDTTSAATVTTVSEDQGEKELHAPPAPRPPETSNDIVPSDEIRTAESEDEEVARIIAEAARLLEQEEAERSSPVGQSSDD